MDKDQLDPMRNEPVEKGRKNDPNLRDDSAIQPGVETVSESDYDEANEHLTDTSSGSFGQEKRKDNADPAFDEIDGDDA